MWEEDVRCDFFTLNFSSSYPIGSHYRDCSVRTVIVKKKYPEDFLEKSVGLSLKAIKQFLLSLWGAFLSFSEMP